MTIPESEVAYLTYPGPGEDVAIVCHRCARYRDREFGLTREQFAKDAISVWENSDGSIGTHAEECVKCGAYWDAVTGDWVLPA